MSKPPNSMQIKALEYIRNTGGRVPAAIFDEDHEPIGPTLRKDMVPTYMNISDGSLSLTDEGKRAIGETT